MRWNLLDLILLLAVLGSVVTAAIKGFTYEVVMSVAAVVGIGVAAWKFEALAALAPSGGAAASVAAFVLLFVAVMAAAMLLARLLRGLVRGVGLGLADRAMGAALGTVRGVLIAAALLLMLVAYPFNPRWVGQSRLAPELLWVSQALAWAMPRPLRSRFGAGMALVRASRRSE